MHEPFEAFKDGLQAPPTESSDGKWSWEILPMGHERGNSIRQLLEEHLLELSLTAWSWGIEVDQLCLVLWTL